MEKHVFSGKINYKGSFSIAMFVYQRVCEAQTIIAGRIAYLSYITHSKKIRPRTRIYPLVICYIAIEKITIEIDRNNEVFPCFSTKKWWIIPAATSEVSEALSHVDSSAGRRI
jgi:hypothetical protein